ncbi:hypothetical protein SKAU_G00256360 [Synaphobranchus kaupii]|uniref:Uncharacterized protein n=1 Tax=Synaphobranchus kaupii TaxID=118154 RepID=A0A9Q1F3X9_SYNKA|nr:hypothetical protein SKAU_G00256360 [Synaphobranchus kaupii]
MRPLLRGHQWTRSPSSATRERPANAIALTGQRIFLSNSAAVGGIVQSGNYPVVATVISRHPRSDRPSSPWPEEEAFLPIA